MTKDKPYQIHALELGPMGNRIYLIEDSASGTAAVVDPAWEVEEVTDLARARRLRITHILLTHTHQDHVNGLDRLRAQAPDARVHLLKAEADIWGDCPVDAHLHQDGDLIQLGETTIRVMHTPGHTPGSVCYHLGDDLITGDTLFVFGCGRCDLKGGDPAAMFHTLARLQQTLPGGTVIHPGHDYGVKPQSTLKEQAEGNPFMQFYDVAAFTRSRMHDHDQIRDTPYGPVRLP